MKVTVVSSFTDDVILLESGSNVQPGGPAFFITSFFEKNDVRFDLYNGDRGLVEIDMRDQKEVGRIVSVGRITASPAAADLLLVSTLLDEFDLRAQGKMSCLDVQGYVRDWAGFGMKKMFDSDALAR